MEPGRARRVGVALDDAALWTWGLGIGVRAA